MALYPPHCTVVLGEVEEARVVHPAVGDPSLVVVGNTEDSGSQAPLHPGAVGTCP